MSMPGPWAAGADRCGLVPRRGDGPHGALAQRPGLVGGVRAPGIECAGMGGTFSVSITSFCAFALTGDGSWRLGAASVGTGRPAAYGNASHMLLPGQVLVIGAVRAGAMAYLVLRALCWPHVLGSGRGASASSGPWRRVAGLAMWCNRRRRGGP